MTNLSTSLEADSSRITSDAMPVSADAPRVRVFALGMWALALGYFAFYAPYAALVRITTTGVLAGIDEAGSRLAMVLTAGVATAFVTPLIVTGLGWWKYAGRRAVLGVSIPWPTRRTLLAGLATSLIIYTTTLMYSFSGVSIVLAMLLMRAGVLMLAPVVDCLFKRRVRWFSWTAFGLSLAALAAVAAELRSYQLTWALGVTVGAYVGAYAVRLHCMNTQAKSRDSDATRRYFVEEQMVAMAVLIVVPLAVGLVGSSGFTLETRRGFASLLSANALWPSLLIGGVYACLYCFGTSIYLDRRENTFCISLNRCSSVLAVVVASYAIAFLFGAQPPNAGELTSVALLAIAMLVLSPLHHLRVRRIRFEEPVSDGWLVFRRSPSSAAPFAINATDR